MATWVVCSSVKVIYAPQLDLLGKDSQMMARYKQLVSDILLTDKKDCGKY
jgi:hypothetical protein